MAISPRQFWWPVAASVIFTAGIFTGRLTAPPVPAPVLAPALQQQNVPAAPFVAQAETPVPKVPQKQADAANEPGTTPDAQVLELFLPSEQQLTTMHESSLLDATLEHIMVMSYTLVNCSRMSDAEYEQTYNALLRYIAQHPAGQSPETRASEAAKRAIASYKLIYRHASCEDPSLDHIATQLRDWRDQALGTER